MQLIANANLVCSVPKPDKKCLKNIPKNMAQFFLVKTREAHVLAKLSSDIKISNHHFESWKSIEPSLLLNGNSEFSSYE